MTTPSLSKLTIQKIPLTTILEYGLLKANLPPQDIAALEERVNLENLYREGLLTLDLDPAILYLALKNLASDMVWIYIDRDFSEFGDIPTFAPLSMEGLRWMKEEYGYSQKAAEEATQDALRNIMTDILAILNHPGEYLISVNPQGSSHRFAIIWDRVGDRYRLFTHWYGPLTLSESHEIGEESTPVLHFANNLNEFLNIIFNVLINQEEVHPLWFSIEPPGELNIQQRFGLSTLRDAYGGNLDIIYKQFWNNLSVAETRELELSINRLSCGYARIRVIGNYVYIFFSYSLPIYYRAEDGDLIIASLVYNTNKWRFISSD
jgi:hypothetical protein